VTGELTTKHTTFRGDRYGEACSWDADRDDACEAYSDYVEYLSCQGKKMKVEWGR